TKYLLHQVQLLSPLDPVFFERRERKLDELVEALGEEHDLTVLAENLGRNVAGFTTASDMSAIKGTIRKRQKSLRKKAMKAGTEVFRQESTRLKLPYIQ